MGFSDMSTAEEREDKLKSRLERLKVPDLLCSLNKVFSVNFQKTPIYQTLTETQKTRVLAKMLRNLALIVSIYFHYLIILFNPKKIRDISNIC